MYYEETSAKRKIVIGVISNMSNRKSTLLASEHVDVRQGRNGNAILRNAPAYFRADPLRSGHWVIGMDGELALTNNVARHGG